MKTRTAAAASLAFLLLAGILLFGAINGGDWESATLDTETFDIRLDFGLAHTSYKVNGFEVSVSYSDLVDSLDDRTNIDPQVAAAFRSLASGGKIVSGMLGVAFSMCVISLIVLGCLVANKLQRAAVVAPIASALCTLFSLLSFAIWAGKCHSALEVTFSGSEDLEHVSYAWCFIVCVIATILSAIGFIWALIAHRASNREGAAFGSTEQEELDAGPYTQSLNQEDRL